MGQYIKTNSKGESIGSTYNEKIQALLNDDAYVLEEVLPYEKSNLSFQENMICVVDNGKWAAAAYTSDEKDFQRFDDPKDGRFKTWLIHPNASTLVQ